MMNATSTNIAALRALSEELAETVGACYSATDGLVRGADNQPTFAAARRAFSANFDEVAKIWRSPLDLGKLKTAIEKLQQLCEYRLKKPRFILRNQANRNDFFEAVTVLARFAAAGDCCLGFYEGVSSMHASIKQRFKSHFRRDIHRNWRQHLDFKDFKHLLALIELLELAGGVPS